MTGGDDGQSTLEYALLLFAFVAALGALGVVWHAARDGRVVGLAAEAASHGEAQGLVGQVKDIALF